MGRVRTWVHWHQTFLTNNEGRVPQIQVHAARASAPFAHHARHQNTLVECAPLVRAACGLLCRLSLLALHDGYRGPTRNLPGEVKTKLAAKLVHHLKDLELFNKRAGPRVRSNLGERNLCNASFRSRLSASNFSADASSRPDFSPLVINNNLATHFSRPINISRKFRSLIYLNGPREVLSLDIVVPQTIALATGRRLSICSQQWVMLGWHQCY